MECRRKLYVPPVWNGEYRLTHLPLDPARTMEHMKSGSLCKSMGPAVMIVPRTLWGIHKEYILFFVLDVGQLLSVNIFITSPPLAHSTERLAIASSVLYKRCAGSVLLRTWRNPTCSSAFLLRSWEQVGSTCSGGRSRLRRPSHWTSSEVKGEVLLRTVSPF